VDRVGDGQTPYETSVDVGHLGHVDDSHDAARYLFLNENLATSPAAVNRAFLSPFNTRVDEFNRLMLNSIEGHERKFKFHPSSPTAVSLPSTSTLHDWQCCINCQPGAYHSHDSIKELDETDFHLPMGAESDLLATMHEPGVPPAKLSLKVGCIASIMRNLSIEDGLVKNARVQVVSLRPNVVEVRLLQQGAGRPRPEQADMPTFFLPRITFEFDPHGASWTVQRRQFPLRLAYATTFNSCQGLTLDRVVLDLTKPVFAHGQLYTSLSRVRSGSDVRVLRSADERHLPTSNVVYRILLLPTEDGDRAMSIEPA